MNKEQAIQILEQALNHANLKGAFNLQDSYNIVQAIATIKQITEDEVLKTKPGK